MIIRVKAVVLMTVSIVSIAAFVIRVSSLVSTRDLSITEWTVILIVGFGLLLLAAWTVHEIALAESLGEL